MSDGFLLSPGGAAKYDQITLIEGMDPGVWTVEAITDGGDIEYESFTGPDGQGRAREYARHKYPGQKVRVGKWISGNPRFVETGEFTA